jgi:hypothetical protein
MQRRPLLPIAPSSSRCRVKPDQIATYGLADRVEPFRAPAPTRVVSSFFIYGLDARLFGLNVERFSTDGVRLQ